LGRVWLRGGLAPSDLAKLEEIFASLAGKQRIKPDVVASLSQFDVHSKIEDLVASSLKTVRAVAFDKSKEKNWTLGWHQDRVIPVAKRHRSEGYKNWTLKSGIWHCEPPEDVFRGMYFVRFHLDACSSRNGAMEVLPASHREGVLSTSKIRDLSRTVSGERCDTNPGDVLILDMLTVHRSGPSETKAARRCLRVDYATGPLPFPFEWPL